MSNEKHNDPFGWKSKLEGLTGLAGEDAMDNEASWQKLERRLQDKPRKSKAGWYWAAACILAALFIPMMMNKKENGVVKSSSKEEIKITPLLVPSTSTNEMIQAHAEVEPKLIENPVKKDKNSIGIKATQKKEEPVVVAERLIEKDPVATVVPTATDTASTIVAAVPLKKKLSVVHINELGPSSVQAFTPVNFAQAPVKIRYRNTKPAEQSFATQQTTVGFKIRLSPKN
jgi:hypothetical protein